MSHKVIAMINKLRWWCVDGWKTYNVNNSNVANFTLQIHYDQLFILSGNAVLESLNLNGRMKSIFKDDILILIICNSPQQVRKIKFQIKTNVAQCLEKLSLHIPVVNYKSLNSEHEFKFKKVEEVFKEALNNKETMSGPPLPNSFNDFVKLCLLDPHFPQMVDETQKILKDLELDVKSNFLINETCKKNVN